MGITGIFKSVPKHCPPRVLQSFTAKDTSCLTATIISPKLQVQMVKLCLFVWISYLCYGKETHGISEMLLMFTSFFFQLSQGKNASWWRCPLFSFQSHSNLLPLAGLTGSLCSALSTGWAVQQQWLKNVSLFQEPPRAHFQTSLQLLAVDTPAKASLVARALSEGHGALSSSFSTGYSSNKRSPRQEHCGFFYFSFRRIYKHVKPLQKHLPHEENISAWIEVLWSGASCRVCVTAGYLCGSQLGRRVGNRILSGDEGCTHTGLCTHVFSCPVAVITESPNIRS